MAVQAAKAPVIITNEVKIALGMLLSKGDMVRLGFDIDCLNDITDYLFDFFLRVGMHAKVKFFPNVSWTTDPATLPPRTW